MSKKISDEERLRLERKKRIAAASKKKNSYASRNKEKVRRIKKITGITVAAAVALGVAIFFLSFFGVFNRISTACRVGDVRITTAEYQCAYTSVQNSVYQQSEQYASQYGQGYYNQDTDLSEKCAFDSSVTWAEYFQEQALQMIQQVALYRDKEGNELTDAQKKQISKQFDDLASAAKENDHSLGAYIRVAYGTGVNKSVLRKWMEDVNRATNAQDYMKKEYKNSLTSEQIKKNYEDNSSSYNKAEALYYVVSAEPSEKTSAALSKAKSNKEKDKLIASAKNEAKKDAASLYNKIKSNPDKFVSIVSDDYKKHQISEGTKEADVNELTASDITLSGSLSDVSQYPEVMTKWVFDSSRKAGDLTVKWNADYSNNSFSYIIIYEKKAPSPVKTVSVRHILVKPEGLDDKNATDDTWKDAKVKAEKLLKEFKASASEDNFAQLANANTDDPGSSTTGGLYENITPGEMVKEFDAWCFDKSRKAGDTGIVKTEYGYHIMYFISNDGYNWQSVGADDMAQTYMNTETEKLYNANPVKGKYCMRWAPCYSDYKDALKKVAKEAQTTTTESK